MEPKHTVGGYLWLQAVGVAGWWSVLWGWPGARRWFLPRGWPSEVLEAFWLGDGVWLVVGSAVAGTAVLRGWAWSSSAVWAVVGGATYPTLFCFAAAWRSGEAWAAASLMACCGGLTLAMATIWGHAGQRPAAIRATELRPAAAAGWTLIQIVIFWGVFLYVLPQGVRELQRLVGVPGMFVHPGQGWLAGLLFAGASGLGLWSAGVMVFGGGGTPLPTAAAPRLVVRGPYRFVRNPMALAGIVQGLAVGWAWGSVWVLVYAVLGGVLWHVGARPVEERDLAERFGEDYERYRRRVGLWLPRRPRGASGIGVAEAVGDQNPSRPA